MTTDDLLNAATILVTDRGLEGLTLRPLAEKLNMSVSALSHRFGQKSDILSVICESGAQAEHRILDRWRARIGHDARLTCSQLADVADAVMDDLSVPHARLSRLHGELLQAASLRPELRSHVQRWLDIRDAFWAFLAARGDEPSGFDLAQVLSVYAIDEMAYGVALGDDGAYRWLRRLCLNRLCAGVLAPAAQDGAWDLQSFFAVWQEMGGDGPLLFESEKPSATAHLAAEQVAQILLTHGADGITYRSVGKLAGLAPSSLVYHFPKQGDLLRSGLEHIIRTARVQAGVDRFLSGAPASSQAASMVATATQAVALAISRYPDLKPFVADMRRRRGENGLDVLRTGASAPERIDRLTAQTVSVASMGALVRERMTGGTAEPGIMTDLFTMCRSAPGA